VQFTIRATHYVGGRKGQVFSQYYSRFKLFISSYRAHFTLEPIVSGAFVLSHGCQGHVFIFLRCRHLCHHHRSYRRRQDAKSVEEILRSFARCKICFLLETVPCSPPISYLMDFLPSVKRLGCEADNSSASGVDVKNECSHEWLHTAMSSWGAERQLDYRSQRIRRVFVDVRNSLFVLVG